MASVTLALCHHILRLGLMTLSSQFSPDERQLKAVIEGVTRALTNFCNVTDRLRRHTREDADQIKLKVDQGRNDAEEKKAILVQQNIERKESNQEIIRAVLEMRALLICMDDNENDYHK